MITRSQPVCPLPVRWIAFGACRRIMLGVLLGGVCFVGRPALATAPAVEARVESRVGGQPEIRSTAGSGGFPVLGAATREQTALVVSAGEDPARWPAERARAVAAAWNAAALEASHTRLTARLLREQWELLVGGAAEAWSRFALVAGSPAAADVPVSAGRSAYADTLAILAGDARALGDDAAAIQPAIDAASEGKRAALLLTTSVGCECTMQRVDLMEQVWTALAAGGSGVPSLGAAGRFTGAQAADAPGGAPGRDLRPLLGRSDLASSPDLPDALGLDRVPGWLLLEPGGEIAFRVDGGEGVAEITTMIRRWLGGEDFHR